MVSLVGKNFKRAAFGLWWRLLAAMCCYVVEKLVLVSSPSSMLAASISHLNLFVALTQKMALQSSSLPHADHLTAAPSLSLSRPYSYLKAVERISECY